MTIIEISTRSRWEQDATEANWLGAKHVPPAIPFFCGSSGLREAGVLRKLRADPRCFRIEQEPQIVRDRSREHRIFLETQRADMGTSSCRALAKESDLAQATSLLVERNSNIAALLSVMR